MDIEVVAALLGVGEALDVAGQAREMAARRHAAAKEGRRVRWADLTDD